MRIDLIKWITKLHRILGRWLSILLFIWFLSAFVMVFTSFPKVTANMRIDKYDVLNDSIVKGIRLPEMSHKIDVYSYLGEVHVDSGGGDRHHYDINKVIFKWGTSNVQKIDTLYELDQWIPFSKYEKELPIYKVHYNDQQNSCIYILSKSGEVIQSVNRSQKIFAWIGAIPHWLYFKPLRVHRDLWIYTVISLSALACIMLIAGFVAAIPKRKYKRGVYKNHKISGIIFGTTALLWSFSGMMSLTSIPSSWFGSNAAPRFVANDSIKSSHFLLSINKVISNLDKKTKLVSMRCFGSLPYYKITDSKGESIYIDARDSNRIERVNIDQEFIENYIKNSCGVDTSFTCELLEEYDNYYIDRKKRLPLPVYKISIDNQWKSTIYISKYSCETKEMNRASRWNFISYQALHSLRFKLLITNNFVWYSLMFIFLIGGTYLSYTGLQLTIKWIKRKICKVKS